MFARASHTVLASHAWVAGRDPGQLIIKEVEFTVPAYLSRPDPWGSPAGRAELINMESSAEISSLYIYYLPLTISHGDILDH